MKTDIILAGVGGQGILSIATIIASAALENGLYVKQAEVHGMSQRGGDVQSNLRISDKPIASDLIPLGKADIIISLEPMEALRYIPFLDEKGWIVSNAVPFVNIDNYPEIETVINELKERGNAVVFDMDEAAKKVASPRSANMVLLGAASPFINIDPEELKKAITRVFGNKGEKIVESNLKAYAEGRDRALRLITPIN